jgi:hypothetical protein
LASKGYGSDASLTLITGLAGDLASLSGGFAAKGSQESLNQAWLRFGRVQAIFDASRPRGASQPGARRL